MTWLLTRGRVPYLVAMLVATAWLGSLAAMVGVETTNASLDSRDPAKLATYERFRADFGSDEDLLLAVAHPGLLEPDGLAFVAGLTERVARIDGVRRALSLANAEELVSGELGAEPRRIVSGPLDEPGLSGRVREALDRTPDLAALFVSADRRSAAILIEIEDRPGDLRYRGEIIAALRAIAAEPGRDGVSLHLTGIAVQKHDVSEMIARDTRVLMPLAVLVLGGTLATFFRSALGVLLPLAVTGITVAWTLGIYRLAGLELNAITALLPPVLMVLSLAVSVHLIQGWLDASGHPGDRVGRIREVVRELVFPCFFCSLTTAIGFASLATTDTPAVRSFGLFAALGVLLSFAVGITLVPVGLGFLEPPASPRAVARHALVERALGWAAETATARPGRVLLVFGGITAVALAGLPLVRNNTDLVRFLSDDAPLPRDTLFVDENFGGANRLDFVVERSDGTPLASRDAVRRMEELERAVLGRPHVAGVDSVLGVLRQVQRAESGGGALALPADEAAALHAFDLIEAAPDQPLLRKLVDPELRRARVSVRVHAIGTADAAELAASILDEGRRILGAGYSLSATGAFYNVSQDSNRLVASQVRSFALAVALVFLAIGALFRSLRLTWIAFVPNVMPVAWTGGLMGFLGIDLSTGTAMIASAVIGVVVDDTIHYLTGFTRAYRGDAREAVRRTTCGTGAALFVNNVVLVLGFWVGAFGSFKPTIYFSLLSGMTMISALVCDLFVTPACLILLDRRRRTPACA